jgi:hypothetical protein
VEFVKELKNSGCLNTMHVLLVYLQQAPLVQHPLAATMLLQLDLLVTSPPFFPSFAQASVLVLYCSNEEAFLAG